MGQGSGARAGAYVKIWRELVVVMDGWRGMGREKPRGLMG